VFEVVGRCAFGEDCSGFMVQTNGCDAQVPAVDEGLSQDSQYVACVAQVGVGNSGGPAAIAL
jgi:hypothetical protein